MPDFPGYEPSLLAIAVFQAITRSPAAVVAILRLRLPTQPGGSVEPIPDVVSR